MKVTELVNRVWRRNPDRRSGVVIRFCIAVLLGTVLAFLISLLSVPLGRIVAPYLRSPLPTHSFAQAFVVILSLALIAIFNKFPAKIWRSLKRGLIPISSWVWVLSVAVFWIASEHRHPKAAWGSIALATLVTVSAHLVSRRPTTNANPTVSGLLEPDLPVQENGEDLLGRGDIIESLVSTILLESPAIVAVTGKYGDGKTSFLNLAIGELKKSEEIEIPMIVRFSPWLAGDSNALVLSLLNSIVAEIERKFVVPGLRGDASRYARTLLSVVSRTERLKDLIAEPSQEGRIDALVNRIAKVRRRLLVVLDDLDRTEAKELETVLKFLRGSDKLSNITFLCAFDKNELALILKETRPHQDTKTFIEKFFPVEFELPQVEPTQLQDLFFKGIARILERNAIPHDNLLKSIEEIWDRGGSLYIRNLRRIKLFLNKIGRSLELIAREVNIEDFIRLELIRDIEPSLYEEIYRDRNHFWNGDFAIETWYKGPYLGEEAAEKDREEFYKKLKASLPEEKWPVLQLLEDLFPKILLYRKMFGTATGSPDEAEKARRIYHPRCFRQYFLLKVPSELFPQKQFEKFLSSVRNQGEEEAAQSFQKTFRSIVNEEFKRWHFMHLIDNRFDEIEPHAARGLCRGMARNSEFWPTDAFELFIAIRRTGEAFAKIVAIGARKEFLRVIVQESASDLYTLSLIGHMVEHFNADPSALAEGEQFKAIDSRSVDAKTESNAKLLSDVQIVKGYIREQLREHYLIPDAPSVFEQFQGLSPGANRIDPVWFLFAWQCLGSDAASDEQAYLRSLLARRPEELNQLLKMMFRARFIDDYTTLKSRIDYKELSDLIALNEDKLDPEKVQEFRKRFDAEQRGSRGSQPGEPEPQQQL